MFPKIGVPQNGWFGGISHYFWKHPSNPPFRIIKSAARKPRAILDHFQVQLPRLPKHLCLKAEAGETSDSFEVETRDWLKMIEDVCQIYVQYVCVYIYTYIYILYHVYLQKGYSLSKLNCLAQKSSEMRRSSTPRNWNLIYLFQSWLLWTLRRLETNMEPENPPLGKETHLLTTFGGSSRSWTRGTTGIFPPTLGGGRCIAEWSSKEKNNERLVKFTKKSPMQLGEKHHRIGLHKVREKKDMTS